MSEKKPSEQIDQAAQAHLLRHIAVPRDPSLAELHEVRAYMRFVLEHLDGEQERRAAFERETLERLAKLEGNARTHGGMTPPARYEPEPESEGA